MSKGEKAEVEENRSNHFRRHAKNYAKMVVAVTGLTAAVNRYLDLEKKNEVVYEALAEKVNGISRELSELKGQNHILLMFIRSRMGSEAEVLSRPKATTPSSFFAHAGDSPEMEKAADEAESKGEKSESAITSPVVFQELPAKVEDLLQAQQRKH